MELPHTVALQVPDRDVNYHHTLNNNWRSGLKPLHVVQPDGPSFQVSCPVFTACIMSHPGTPKKPSDIRMPVQKCGMHLHGQHLYDQKCGPMSIFDAARQCLERCAEGHGRQCQLECGRCRLSCMCSCRHLGLPEASFC